jgi:hypothetical protein
LHGHTSQSKETLDFLANFGNQFPLMRPLIARALSAAAKSVTGIKINYHGELLDAALTPKLAFDLEAKQIEKLG